MTTGISSTHFARRKGVLVLPSLSALELDWVLGLQVNFEENRLSLLPSPSSPSVVLTALQRQTE